MTQDRVVYGQDDPLEPTLNKLHGFNPLIHSVRDLLVRSGIGRRRSDVLVIGKAGTGRIITQDPWNHFSAEPLPKMNKSVPGFVLAEGANANYLKS